MGNPLNLLCILFFVLLVIASVGHGLWLVMAWIFQSLFSSAEQNLALRRRCIACSRSIGPYELYCNACGSPQASVWSGREADALDAIIRQINHLEKIGAIDNAVRERLVSAVQTETQKSSVESQAARVETDVVKSQLPIVESPQTRKEEVETGRPGDEEVVQLPISSSPDRAPSDPAERVRAFAARQAEHDTEIEDAEPAEEKPPSKPFSQLMAAFLEERNIRWGELAGGLLIVCGSIALVLSFWAQIAERPFLQFFVFNSVTAALFALGIYADRRMKLPTTSHGLLVIASLLVPLNILALAAFSQKTPPNDAFTIVGELISIGLFAWLIHLAGKVILSRGSWRLVVGVIGPSIATLLVRRWVDEATATAVLYSVAALPLICYGIATGEMIWHAQRPSDSAHADINETEANEIFRLLGLTSFAALLPLALLVAKTGNYSGTLRDLAPLVSLAAAPALAIGLMLWRRVTDPKLAGVRTVGTTIAVLGALILMSGLAFAWPNPSGVVPVALVNFFVLTVIALLFKIPAAHLLAAPCLAVAYLVGFHVAVGDVAWSLQQPSDMAAALFTAKSGMALTPMTLVLGLAAVIWMRLGRQLEGLFYAMVAGVSAAVSLALVTWFGFGRLGDPSGATWVYALYAAGALAAALWTQRAAVGWIASCLLLAALVQGIVFKFALPLELAQPRLWLWAMLAHATAMALTAVGSSIWRRSRGDTDPTTTQRLTSAFGRSDPMLSNPLGQSALITSIVAAGLWAWSIQFQTPEALVSLYALWIAAIWFALYCLSRSASLFAVFQAALTAAVLFAVAALLKRQSFSNELQHLWLDPWSLQAQGIALALLSLGWSLVRIVGSRRGESEGGKEDGGKEEKRSREGEEIRSEPAPVSSSPRHSSPSPLLRPGWTCDRFVAVLTLLLLVSLSVYGALPGAAAELSPRSLAAQLEGVSLQEAEAAGRLVPSSHHFELGGLPHEHALDIGGWILLAAVAIAFLASQWVRHESINIIALLLAFAMICPLLAGRFEVDVAVASAMRWFSAAFLAVASAVIWMRDPLARCCARLRWPGFDDRPRKLGPDATALALALAALPLAAMVLFMSVAAVAQRPIEPSLVSSFQVLAIVFAVSGSIAIGLLGFGSGWFDEPRKSAAKASRNWPKQVSTLLLILGAAPLVAVSLYVVSAALKGNPVAGPEPGSFFKEIGLAVSYALPITLVALTLVGFALRNRSPGFAFAGGLLFNVSATAAYLLVAAKGGLKLDTVLWIKIGQLNAAVTAGYALAWSAAVIVWIRRGRKTEAKEEIHSLKNHPVSPSHALLVTQTLLGVALNLFLILPGLVRLFLDPRLLDPLSSQAHIALASPLGWAALLISLVSSAVLCRAMKISLAPGTVCAAILSVGALIAFASCAWDTGDWLAYHVMMIVFAATPWLLLGGYYAAGKWRTQQIPHRHLVASTASVVGTIAVVLALREAFSFSNPWWVVSTIAAVPWWAVSIIAAMSLLAACLGCWSTRRRYLYVAGSLINLAVTIAWLYQRPGGAYPFGKFLVELVEVNVIAISLPVVAWVLLELRFISRDSRAQADALASELSTLDPQPSGLDPRLLALDPRLSTLDTQRIGFHRVAAVMAVIGMAFVVGLGLSADAAGDSLEARALLAWAALASAVIAVVACLWDSWAKAPMAWLYALGLAMVGMTLDQFDLSPRMIAFTGTMILAAYAIATSYLWSRREGLRTYADLLRIPYDRENAYAGLTWLVAANGILTTVVLVASYTMVLTFAERPLRLALGQAALLQTVALALLARGEKRTPLQYAALVVGVIGFVAWGWAWLDPETTGSWINRTVVVTVALGAMTALYGLGLGKFFPRQTEWIRAAGRLVPVLAGLGVASILIVMGTEAVYFLAGEKVSDFIAWPAIIAIGGTLLGLVVAALIAAVVPGRDPLGLSERGRTAYVYAAEGLLALLFLHIRLTKPALFHGFFGQYWTFIVVIIAFAGVGLSEIFRRQKRNVLADPLERTSALLPLLPVLGFWVVPAQGSYSLVLLLVGVLYSALSVTRRSFGFGLLAALAANGGLWFYLQQVEGYGLLEHPQIWLIPISLCVLAAGHLNRHQLSPQQLTTIRYITSLTIYISSTADIFIRGVAQSPWLPLVLAGLSIGGIFLGILLRVRAFLFLGTSFLVLALITIIWYAASQYTWILWLSVVFAGILIIALFALFEKKRHEVLNVVEQIKQWEP